VFSHQLKPQQPKPQNIVGWDIGGAHLKAALLDAKGNVLQVAQLPCPLWRGLHELETAMQNMLQAFKMSPAAAKHAVTMTGELADCFASRYDGVCAIAKLAVEKLGDDTLFYAAQNDFVAFHDVKRFATDIASSNWHASASALATQFKDALFIDIGSTTTDIIPIINGKIATDALSDAARLQNDTLIYTGVARTPVMALAQKLPFDGVEVNVMAELFATMADVYRLTGELDASADMAETADGKGKTPLESARRLARMIGRDVDKSLANWITLAHACRSLQIFQIKCALLTHLKPNMTIIGAGAGSFLVRQIAQDLARDYKQACEVLPVEPASMRLAGHVDNHKNHDVDVCFSAFAVAHLALNHTAKTSIEMNHV
jgi:(4-(4-[2-(gamma-L-glutamylamino)ethyl]phenoxymethyl)furan-2-yl)methanamine synthase